MVSGLLPRVQCFASCAANSPAQPRQRKLAGGRIKKSGREGNNDTKELTKVTGLTSSLAAIRAWRAFFAPFMSYSPYHRSGARDGTVAIWVSMHPVRLGRRCTHTFGR